MKRHIDLSSAIGNPVARTVARGLVKGMARHWTIGELRELADRGAGFNTLEHASPQFTDRLRHMSGRFPGVRGITFEEVEAWVREVNPQLGREVDADPNVKSWLRRAWTSGVQGLGMRD